ncbi:MerR family transcriptional regulator [Streptomyces sp. NPDC018584]
MAELAGSLRAVRHYHAIGLLDEPERRSNGYKQYGVNHLVRLLRIKRLAALGFSLSQIVDMRDGPDSDPDPRDLRARDEELAAAIERLQHARAEVGALMRRTATADLPLRLATSTSFPPMRTSRRARVSLSVSCLRPRSPGQASRPERPRLGRPARPAAHRSHHPHSHYRSLQSGPGRRDAASPSTSVRYGRPTLTASGEGQSAWQDVSFAGIPPSTR